MSLITKNNESLIKLKLVHEKNTSALDRFHMTDNTGTVWGTYYVTAVKEYGIKYFRVELWPPEDLSGTAVFFVLGDFESIFRAKEAINQNFATVRINEGMVLDKLEKVEE